MNPILRPLLQEFFDKEEVQKELTESDSVSYFKIIVPDGEILMEVNPGRMMEFRMLLRGNGLNNRLNFQDLLQVFNFIEDDEDELFHIDTDVNEWLIQPGTDFHALPIEYQDMLENFGISWQYNFDQNMVEITERFNTSQDTEEVQLCHAPNLYITIKITDYAS